MKKLFFTKHASTRCQQRGINKDVAAFIFNYGIKSNTHEDERFIVTNKCIKRNFYKDDFFQRFFLKYEKQIRGTAIIVKRDSLITVMKLTKGVKNNTSSLRKHRAKLNNNFNYSRAS
tara:strand:- start:9453 stop:9803 length:351 start_codon:yes stop_codon:yes gene_type:complete